MICLDFLLISGINIKDSFLAMSPTDVHKIQTTI